MPSCSAINCSNTHEKGFRMFCFPREEARKKQWIANVRRKKWNPTSSSRLCEVHFEASQFESHRLDEIKKIKPNAVPTLFDFSNQPKIIVWPLRKSVCKKLDNVDENENNPKALSPNNPDASENVPAMAKIASYKSLDSDSNFDPDEEDYEDQPIYKNSGNNKNDKNNVKSGLFQCSHCSSTFSTFDELKMKHMKLHNVNSETTIDNNSFIEEDITSEDQEDTDSSKKKQKLGVISKPSRKFSADLPQVYLTDHNLLVCIICGHQTIKEFPMRVHRILCQQSQRCIKNVTWLCPKGSDCFQSSTKSKFIKHVQDIHQLKEEDYRHQVYGELKMMDYQTSTATGKVFNCHFCEFSASLKLKVLKHVQHDHPKRQCDFCETMIQGEFQMFWHIYTVHGNALDYDNWRLECTVCSHKSLAKPSYQHGGTHKQPIVKFKTIFQDVVKGIVPFLYILKEYTNHAEADKQINKKAEGKLDNDDFEACTLDFADSDNFEEIAEIFTASDKETCNGGEADSKISCKSCHFTTDNGPYLCMHQQLHHKSVNQTHFFCPLPNCCFESQYRCNLRRHLLKTHKINVKILEIPYEDVTAPTPIIIIESLTCENCNFEAETSELLSIHVQVFHSVYQRTEADPFRCPIKNCRATTPYKNNFQRHLMRCHSIKTALGNAGIGSSVGLRMRKAPSTRPTNADASKGKWKFPFKKHIQKRMEVEENEVSKKGFGATKWKTKYESESSDRYVGRHTDFGLFWRPKFSCPFEGCSHVVSKRLKFKRHLTLLHKLNESKLRKWNGIDNFISQFVRTFKCLKCGFDRTDMKELKNHFRKEHRITETRNKSSEKYSKAAKSFLLKCTQCTFETNVKSRAHLHGLRHYKNNNNRSVVFRKYINCERQDDLVYRYPNKTVLKCPICDFRAVIERDLTKHMLNFHPLKATNSLTSWNIKIAKQRMSRRAEIRQRNQKRSVDAKEKELCKILVTQNMEMIIDNDGTIEENNEVIKIVLVDTEEVNYSNSEELDICTICKKQFLSKADLVSHINAEHILVPKPKARIKTGKVPPDKVSFICYLCNQVLFSTLSLKKHTNVHAKAAKNFNLKVTFTKFKGGLKLNTVTIEADDPKCTPKDKNPVLDYDPELKVFSCEECDFKTNQAEVFAKHKKLHWTKEKEEIYKSKKWFTCVECFYYCFDQEMLKKHTEMHRNRVDLSLYGDLMI